MYVGTPWKMARTPSALRGPTPNRGEYDDYVFGELLGLGDAEFAELRSAGVI